MRERDIEQYLVRKARDYGGRAYKWVSPGNNGVPDRIVTLPGGRIAFAELKAPGKRPTGLQVNQQQFLFRQGLPVVVIDSKEGVDDLLNRMRDYGGLPPWPELNVTAKPKTQRRQQKYSKVDDERPIGIIDEDQQGGLPPWPEQ